MHELLFLSPANFAIALVNYALLHGAYKVGKLFLESHFADERKQAIMHHFRNDHQTDINTCTTEKCATL